MTYSFGLDDGGCDGVDDEKREAYDEGVLEEGLICVGGVELFRKH